MKTFIIINIIIKIIKMNKVLPNQYDCSICLSGLDDYCITPCSHLFHEECLKKSTEISESCPLCRKHMTHYYNNGHIKIIQRPIIEEDLCYFDMSEEYEEEDNEEKEETESIYESNEEIPSIYMYLSLCLCVVFVSVTPFIIAYRSCRYVYRSMFCR